MMEEGAMHMLCKRLAELEKANQHLVEANNRYLERARAAEALNRELTCQLASTKLDKGGFADDLGTIESRMRSLLHPDAINPVIVWILTGNRVDRAPNAPDCDEGDYD